jgi:hypothetical protein
VKALWLRVDAHKIDSREVCEIADALGIDVVQALGHVVALGGAVAEHTDDGNIAIVADTTLERWARWSGKRGAFAPALRRALQDENGEYDHWHEEMGQLVERRARDRQRKTGGDSTEIPRKRRGESKETGRDSAATERDVTERNGTGRSASSSTLTTPNSGAEYYDGTLRARAQARELPAPLLAALAEEPEHHRDAIAAWLNEFHPDDDSRRRDVARQLLLTLTPTGASIKRGHVVRAGSVARLAAKCLEVYRDGSIRRRDRAIVVLLKKLGDTSDGSAPGEQERQVYDRQAMDDAATAENELTAAVVWLAEHRDIAESIDRQLALEYPAGEGKTLELARGIAKNQRIVDAYREHLEREEPAHA